MFLKKDQIQTLNDLVSEHKAKDSGLDPVLLKALGGVTLTDVEIEMPKEASDDVYERVATELESDERKEGLWLKAMIEAEGDEPKAKYVYAQFRVEEIIQKQEQNKLDAKLSKETAIASAEARKERSEKLQRAQEYDIENIRYKAAIREYESRKLKLSKEGDLNSLLRKANLTVSNSFYKYIVRHNKSKNKNAYHVTPRKFIHIHEVWDYAYMYAYPNRPMPPTVPFDYGRRA